MKRIFSFILETVKRKLPFKKNPKPNSQYRWNSQCDSDTKHLFKLRRCSYKMFCRKKTGIHVTGNHDNILYKVLCMVSLNNQFSNTYWITALVWSLVFIAGYQKKTSFFSKCLVFYEFLCCYVCWFLYGPFGHGALKLDISKLFTTFFPWTSLQSFFSCLEQTSNYPNIFKETNKTTKLLALGQQVRYTTDHRITSAVHHWSSKNKCGTPLIIG